MLGCAGLRWAALDVLGWAGLRWAGAGMCWAGLYCAMLGWAGLGWAGLGWAGMSRAVCCRAARCCVQRPPPYLGCPLCAGHGRERAGCDPGVHPSAGQ